MEDSNEEEELAEFHVDRADDVEEVEESVGSSLQSRRGRPRIPEQWTRVISLEHDELDQVKSHVLATDLMLTKNLPLESGERRKVEWKPHFHAQAFAKANRKISMEDFRLTE